MCVWLDRLTGLLAKTVNRLNTNRDRGAKERWCRNQQVPNWRELAGKEKLFFCFGGLQLTSPAETRIGSLQQALETQGNRPVGPGVNPKLLQPSAKKPGHSEGLGRSPLPPRDRRG